MNDVVPRVADGLQTLMGRVWRFFSRLQWRLTLSYALFTAIAALVFGVIGVAFLWYLAYWSWIPTGLATDLVRVGQGLSRYLDDSAPDADGLNEWLLAAVVDDVLTSGVPPANGRSDGPLPPPPVRLGRVALVVVADAEGKVLSSYPAGSLVEGEWLSVRDEAAGIWAAALHGERNAREMATRSGDGNILAAAPIIGASHRLLGAIYVETVPAIPEWRLLQNSVRQTIVPVVLGILSVGIVVGVFFGFFIAIAFIMGNVGSSVSGA